MRIKIQHSKRAFYGGVIGKTGSGKLVVNLDNNSRDKIDLYRKMNQVIIIKNGRLIKSIAKLL